LIPECGLRDKVLQLFDRYIIADDVVAADISDTLIAVGLDGPESRAVLERAGITVPDLEYLQFAEVPWRQQTVTLLRAGEEARESWQVWIAPNKRASFGRLWSARGRGLRARRR
jgi:glycine cleavage system aminomethyltransferase T